MSHLELENSELSWTADDEYELLMKETQLRQQHRISEKWRQKYEIERYFLISE